MSKDRIKALPIWKVPILIDPLHGGLSNESYLVTDKSGKFVVRIGIDYPFHHVFRDREVMSAKAAFAAGFGPEVVHSEPGLMVSRFIEGRTYTANDVRENIPRIARLLRDFHNEMPAKITGLGFIFWPFHVIRDYANTLGNDRYLNLNTELEAAQTPLPIIFAHNDLLPANFIDDGTRLWLIDFEYAGFSTAMFDLAGVSANAQFTPEQSAELMSEYFQTKPTPALTKSLLAMQCAALLREALWALVSERHLQTHGVDFAAYAQENFTRLDAALETYRTHT